MVYAVCFTLTDFVRRPEGDACDVMGKYWHLKIRPQMIRNCFSNQHAELQFWNCFKEVVVRYWGSWYHSPIVVVNWCLINSMSLEKTLAKWPNAFIEAILGVVFILKTSDFNSSMDKLSHAVEFFWEWVTSSHTLWCMQLLHDGI